MAPGAVNMLVYEVLNTDFTRLLSPFIVLAAVLTGQNPGTSICPPADTFSRHGQNGISNPESRKAG
jgi:hypothetical protein